MKQLKIISLIVLIAFSSSCKKEPDVPTVEGDTVVVSRRSGTNVVYGVAFYANSLSSLKTVTVVSSANPSGILSLSANGNDTYYFLREPSESEYSATKPTAATYTFNAVFDGGETSEYKDILTSDALAPVTFEKCLYNTTNSYAELSWTALANANSYVIQFIDGTGTIVFNSSELPNTIISGTLSSSAGGWKSGFPKAGDIYTVRIYALEYEDAAGGNYQMQSTSISDATMVWGN
jgi:hypothetical protein